MGVDLEWIDPRSVRFEEDGTAVITLNGEIDHANCDGITGRMHYALRSAAVKIRLNMSEVTFMDSAGLGALIHGRLACQTARVPLILCRPSAVVLRLLHVTGLLETFGLPAADPPTRH